jgi:hypothetical protein
MAAVVHEADTCLAPDHPHDTDPPMRAVYVDAELYAAARHIADLRSESVDAVVTKLLRRYARGRARPRD